MPPNNTNYAFVKMCCIIQISVSFGVTGNFSKYKDTSELTLSCAANSNYANYNTEDYTFLYNYLQGTGMHNFNESVTIGFLGAYGQAQVVLGALPLAIENVNNDSGNYTKLRKRGLL